MWFKRKTNLFADTRTVEWAVGEIAVIRQQIEEFKVQFETHTRHINSLRGLINRSPKGPGGDSPTDEKEAREFYESTIEFAELNKGLNNPKE